MTTRSRAKAHTKLTQSRRTDDMQMSAFRARKQTVVPLCGANVCFRAPKADICPPLRGECLLSRPESRHLSLFAGRMSAFAPRKQTQSRQKQTKADTKQTQSRHKADTKRTKADKSRQKQTKADIG
eukprot:6582070-Pyramimonas_sp.AAC.1